MLALTSSSSSKMSIGISLDGRSCLWLGTFPSSAKDESRRARQSGDLCDATVDHLCVDPGQSNIAMEDDGQARPGNKRFARQWPEASESRKSMFQTLESIQRETTEMRFRELRGRLAPRAPARKDSYGSAGPTGGAADRPTLGPELL